MENKISDNNNPVKGFLVWFDLRAQINNQACKGSRDTIFDTKGMHGRGIIPFHLLRYRCRRVRCPSGI